MTKFKYIQFYTKFSKRSAMYDVNIYWTAKKTQKKPSQLPHRMEHEHSYNHAMIVLHLCTTKRMEWVTFMSTCTTPLHLLSYVLKCYMYAWIHIYLHSVCIRLIFFCLAVFFPSPYLFTISKHLHKQNWIFTHTLTVCGYLRLSCVIAVCSPYRLGVVCFFFSFSFYSFQFSCRKIGGVCSWNWFFYWENIFVWTVWIEITERRPYSNGCTCFWLQFLMGCVVVRTCVWHLYETSAI